MNVVILILNLLGLVFLVRYANQIAIEFGAAENKLRFFSFRRFRHGISVALIIGIPLILANFIFPLVVLENPFSIFINFNMVWWVATGLAFLISFIWLVYLKRLDIHEPEKSAYLIIIFILAALFTIYPATWMYYQLDVLGVSLHADNSMDYQFLYCVFVIGGIEELFKFLPVVIILLFFKKAIDEPYDYILYGSVSALGFAFIENIDYIYFSQLTNIGGRALYAAVAHMAFTSIACYGLMLWRFNFTKIKGIVIVPIAFFLAMVAHGFYDFWLINEWVVEYQALTTVFFLATVHLWVTMKNNAINVSNFFSSDAALSNDGLRYYLITSLSGLLMLGYLIVALTFGREIANNYLFYEALAYGYLVFYLAFGLSRYRIVKDEMNPLQVPFDFFVPKPVPVEKLDPVEGDRSEGP